MQELLFDNNMLYRDSAAYRRIPCEPSVADADELLGSRRSNVVHAPFPRNTAHMGEDRINSHNPEIAYM